MTTPDQAAGRDVMRTACGRRLAVGHLTRLGPGPVARVTLDVGHEPYDHECSWASLTPEEARTLADLLYLRAAQAERRR